MLVRVPRSPQSGRGPPTCAAAAEADGSAELLSAWEATASQLPGLLAAGSIRERLLSLPTEPPPSVWLKHLQAAPDHAASDSDEWITLCSEESRWLERAYLVLSFLAHSAVWGESPPLATLPSTLAVPWCAVAERLGRRPILTYASFNLHNWRRLDDAGGVVLGNTCRCNNFLGGSACSIS